MSPRGAVPSELKILVEIVSEGDLLQRFENDIDRSYLLLSQTFARAGDLCVGEFL
jgi:hypothetical protein